MAKTPKTTEVGDFRSIPWNKLVRSKKNVRKVPSDDDLEFTEDIAQRGILSSLLVRPQVDDAGADTGLFEVIAGGRRYDAVGRLVEQGRKPDTTPLPCQVRRTGIAEDDSLAENIQRAPLHLLDQYRAFSALIENKMTEEEIAARFFVPVSVVRQRLKLATVSPILLEAFGEDRMRLEQLMAFTVTPDRQRQEQVWEAVSLNIHAREPYHIRRLLTETSVKASDRRVLFVGTDAYVEAGGTMTRDLFEADDGGWLQDVALLERLVREKLDAKAGEIKAEGWLWIDAAIDHPYGHTFGLRQVTGEQIDLTDEEKTELDALTTKHDELTAAYDADDELPDDIDQQLGELEDQIEAFQSRPLQFAPTDVERGGVFLSLTSYGTLRIERGYVRPEDEPAPESAELPSTEEAADGAQSDHHEAMAGNAPPTSPQDSDDEDDLKPLSDRLWSELTAFRTLALRNALANQPKVALTVLLHKLCSDQFYRGGEGTNLEARVTTVSLLAFDGLTNSAPADAINGRNQAWREALPDDRAGLWDWLDALEDVSRLSLLAHCVSYGLNALYQKPDRYGGSGPSPHTIEARLRNADHLAQVLDLDVSAAGWRATAANYFGSVSKAHIMHAIAEAKGDDAARRVRGMSKADMAAEAETLLNGTKWLPAALRTPALDQPNLAPPEPGEVDQPLLPPECAIDDTPDLEAAE